MTKLLFGDIIPLMCPECRAGILTFEDDTASCGHCAEQFPVSAGRPVLFARDNQIFSTKDYGDAAPAVQRKSRLAALVPGLSVNLSVKRSLAQMRTRLDASGRATILVVGGGRQRPWLDPLLGAGEPHRIVYCDVDRWADVDLFCDAHNLPFPDDSVDAVVATAVLEHVLYPEQVVAEIARVVRLGGLLYSELPFMQQVHEGAYDFTRYTLSGHRRLFNRFGEIESGMVAGPGTALAWALENFVLGFVGGVWSRKVAKLGSRLLFSWFKYADYALMRRPQAMDGASCTYFFGMRTAEPVSDTLIIQRYVGAKNLNHV